ncbi:MAG: gliding motility-associated C-terminal domain-containing protein [Bacteroidetes bacterium]|nr:gliding motility-associated C-terminal domain-containing protein [Bacteroidota bacterium]
MRHLYRFYLTILISVCLLPVAYATHIVGGALTYIYNGGSNYTITLKLYRDCNGVALPGNVTISVRGYNGATFSTNKDISIALTSSSFLTSNLDSCAVPPNPMPCVQEGIYTITVNNLPPNPGGYHLYYSLCCRNGTISNIVNPSGVGETFYAYIPGTSFIWNEEFTLANGTTVDAGSTAWTRTLGTTPPTYARVENNLFEVSGANNAEATWTSQLINISAYPSGADLSVNLSEASNLEANDSILVYYSLDGGPLTLFTTNGAIANDFTAATASVAGLIGTNVQLFIRVHYDGASNGELYRFDNIMVSDPSTFVANNNPIYNQFPPLFMCQGKPIVFDHSASDANGDSLAYSLYTPYLDVAPTYTNNIAAFTPVTYIGGYSASSPLNSGGPALTLNSSTGMLTGTPNSIGQFVVGIKTSEYRSGTLLSEMVRDFQFNVVNCPPPAQANISGSSLSACRNVPYTFPDSSDAVATNWYWDFGDPAVLTDTSYMQYPSYTYTATGTYTVTLIINKGTSCADTSVQTVTVSVPSTPIAGGTSPVCSGQDLSLTASNIIGATYAWAGPNSFSSSSQNPVIFSAPSAASGTYSVIATVSGCPGNTATVTITVNQTPSATATNNSPICMGVDLSLTASSTGTSYSWTGPNGFTSTSQNPVITAAGTVDAGTYSVTSSANGCTSPVTTTSVVVNPPPSSPILGYNSPACSGQTLSLTASTLAGATYSWTGPNSFSSTLQDPTIAGVSTAASGTYSMTAIVAGCPPLTTVTVSVTINQTPAPPTAGSNSPLCVGADISLTATGTGTTYSWSGPNGYSSTSQNPVISSVTTTDGGSYTVNTTSAIGCTSNDAMVNVVVNPPPPAPTAGSNMPCAGTTLSLTASTIASATYNWSGPNSFTSTLQNPTIANVTTNAAGTYSVTATVPGCSTSPAGTVAVTIIPLPAAPAAGSNSPVCPGQDINLTATASGNPSYSWSGPNNFTSALQNPVITFVTTSDGGTYSVTATENGCAGPAGTVSVTITTPPPAPVAGNNGPVCVGNDLSLTASTIAGVNYFWAGPNGYTAMFQQNPTIASASTVNAGTYSVAVVSIATGCASTISTTTVIVNPSPSAPILASNSPVCSGQTLSLTCSTIIGATYSWSGPNGFSSNSQDTAIGNITTAASGTYSLTASVAGCPPLATETISVTINQTPATPTTGSNSPVCAGNDISLTASSTGATYNWSGPNGFTSSSQNPVIPAASTSDAGSYSVTATSAAGCIGTASTTSVTVNPPPSTPLAGSNSPVCSGQTLSLTSNTIISATYAWNGPNSFTSASQNPIIASVTTAASGTYSVVAFVPGCGSTSVGTVSITINQTPSAPSAGNNSPICSGQDLSLTASATGTTYSWNGPNGFSSSSQNPVINGVSTTDAGTYTVNAVTNGCTSADATTSITINQTPAAPVAGSNFPVCSGQDLSLTASSTGTTYSWSGPNGFISASQNPVISGVTTTEAGTYTVNTTTNGCTSADAVVSVTVNQTPAAPTAGNSSPICSGQTLSLTASNIFAATYNWNGPNSFSSSSQNPIIVKAAIAAAGTYSVSVTVSGCTGPEGITSVTVNPTPTPIVGSNSPVCEGSTLSLTSSTVAGATYDWSGPNGFTSTSQNPTIGVTTSADAGTYTLGVTSALGCVSAPTTTSVIITPPIFVDAGTDQTVCANNATVMLNGSVSGGTLTGNWTTSGSGNFVPNSTVLNATYAPSAADTAAGTVTLTLTSTNNGGCTAVTDIVDITITDAPTANAGADQTVCANNASVTLNGSFTLSSGAGWTTLGSGIFSDTSNMNAVYTPSAADTAAKSVAIILTTTGNGLCNSVSDTMMIIITPAPFVSAGISTVICKSSPNLPLNGYSSTGSGIWTTTGTGTFSPDNVTAGATYMSSAADTIAGSLILIFTSTNNNNCNAEDDSITITYIDKPIVNAGNDQTVCANNASVTLTGSSNTGSGQWTSKGTGTFSPSANLLSTTYIPSAADTSAGTVMLILTSANNGTCNPITDTLIITITDAPRVNAGSDQTVCANNAVVTLNGSFTLSSGAGWTTLGSGTFSPDTSNMNATYTPSSADTVAGSVTIILSSTGNGLCNAVNDTMTIVITPAPFVNAGTNQVICFSNLVATLSGNSSTGTGQWTTLGSGTFGNSSLLSTTYTPSTADTSAGSIQLVLTSAGNGNCNAVTDTLIINYTNSSVVSAGTDQTVCANNSVVTLNGSSSTGSGKWSTSGTGTFTPNDSTLNASYTPSAGDIALGTVTLTITSSGGCTPVSDAILITINPAPIVSAGSDQTVCAGTMTINLGGSVTGPTTTGQWSTSGTGTFTPNNTTLNAQYMLSAADSSAGQVTLTLSSTNNGSCIAVTDPMDIFIIQPAVVNAGNNVTVCGNNSTLLNGTITGGSGTGIWTTPNGSGSFSPNNTTLTASYNAVNADTLVGNVLLILTSTNNGACSPSADTVIATVTPGPAANAGADQTICANNSLALLNGSVFNATGGGWITLGSGTFSPDTSSLNATYNASPADITAGSVILVLQTIGNGPCNPTTDSILITFSPSPLVNAGSDILVCQGDTSAQLNGTVSGGASTGQWSTLGSGTFSPNNSTLNAIYVLSNADTAAGGVTLVLTSTNNGNCFAVTDTVKITITPSPVVNAGADITVCANNIPFALNGSVTIGATTGVWSSSGSGTFTPSDSMLTASYTPSAADTAAGTVVLKLTSTFGCRAVADSLVVTITPAPYVNAGTDVSICSTVTTVTLNGLVSSAATGGSWTSSGNGTFTPNNSTLNATYTPGSNDTTSVTLVLTSTGNGQCLAVTDTMKITIGKKPIAAFSNLKICSGQSIIFTDASTVGGVNDSIVSWNWTIDGGNYTTQNPSHTYSVSGTDSVILIATSNIGCSDTTTQVITIYPSPVAAYTYTMSCLADSVHFTNTSTIASENITSWNWNFGDGFTDTLPNPVHAYSVTGTYVVSLTVASNFSCSSTFAGNVNYAKGVVAAFTKNADCRFNTTFTDASVLSTSDSIISWNWNFGDGKTDTLKNPVHQYTVAGTYTINLSVTTSGGCSDTIADTLKLVPAASADFSTSASTYFQGELINFTDLSINPISWAWDFGDGNTDSVQNTSHTYQQSTPMNVMLIVMNSSGCPDTAIHAFNIIPRTVGIPSAFTPNGDGINDILHVMGKLKEMNWRIYNEWGNEIFHSTDQRIGWDGTYKGTNQPAGRYVYILKGITLSDETIDMNGDVTIIR